MKKKILLFSLAALMVAPVLTSCKKGENDPFISLRSRKARLAGEWKLESGSISGTSGSTSYSETYTESNISYTYGGSSFSDTYSRKLTINKDNTYENVETQDGNVSSEKGTWAFLKKSKGAELKNKEAIILFEESSTSGGTTDTETGTNYGDVLLIDQLKNKEMIIKIENTYSDGSYSSAKTGTLTFVQ